LTTIDDFKPATRLQALATSAAQFARHELQTNGGVLPCVFFIDRNGELGMVVISPDELDHKDRLADTVAALLIKTGAQMYVLGSEAWAAISTDAEPGGNVADRPDRVEVYQLTGRHKDEAFAAAWRIVRGESGKMVDFAEDMMEPVRQIAAADGGGLEMVGPLGDLTGNRKPNA
jgi:hypothetical protein